MWALGHLDVEAPKYSWHLGDLGDVGGGNDWECGFVVGTDQVVQCYDEVTCRDGAESQWLSRNHLKVSHAFMTPEGSADTRREKE